MKNLPIADKVGFIVLIWVMVMVTLIILRY